MTLTFKYMKENIAYFNFHNMFSISGSIQLSLNIFIKHLSLFAFLRHNIELTKTERVKAVALK